MVRSVAALAFVTMAAAGLSQAAEWKTESLDPGVPGQFSSMKVDKEGNLHLAYVLVDGNRYPLRYGFWDHNLKKWFTMTIAEGAGSPTLALDSQQHPRIAYADWGGSSGGKLRYLYWDGKAWQREPILLNSDIVAFYSALALDGHDNPSISFYEYRGPVGTDLKIRMRVVSKKDGHWEVETVDPVEGSGKYNSMIGDAAGHLFLAYANVGSGTAGMRFGYWDGAKWSHEVVDGPEANNGESLGFNAFVTLDHKGNPHISYVNETNNQVRYAARKDGHWQIRIIDRVAAIASLDRNAVALDEADRPYVAYFDAGAGLLKLAHQEGTRWVAEIVDGSGCGFTSSVQIDRGTIWISYTDQVNGGIRVAHRDLTPGPASATARTIESKRSQ